ncbi:MAG: hypothetical protein R3F60_10710 [bacterium]
MSSSISILARPPPAGTLWQPRPIVVDSGWQHRRGLPPVFALHISPPPLLVEDLSGDLDALTLEDLAARVRADALLVIGRLQITNPWPMPVSYFIQDPEVLRGGPRQRPAHGSRRRPQPDGAADPDPNPEPAPARVAHRRGPAL